MNHIFKVGKGFGKKKLEDAVNLAQNNDTILIEAGEYNLTDRIVLNSKNLKFVGDGEVKIYNFGLNASNSNIEIKNIKIEFLNEHNVISIKDQSYLLLQKVYIKSQIPKYPAIYLESSKLTVNNSEIYQDKNDSCVYGTINSNLVVNASILSSLGVNKKSEAVISNSRILDIIAATEESEISSPTFVDIQNFSRQYYSIYITEGSRVNLNTLSGELNILSGKVNDSLLVINEVDFTNNVYIDIEHNDQSTVQAPDINTVRIVNTDELERQNFHANGDGLTIGDIVNNTDEEVENIEEYSEIENQEVYENQEVVNEKSSLEQLEEMYGLAKVKSQVKKFVNTVRFNKQRKEQGLKANNITLHSVFLGNPGTGKTTVARLLGNLLYEEGVIKENKFVEVSRPDLVSEYIGKTALLTKEKLDSAKGGILFIDEAYTLYSNSSNDFGIEAINTILKYMEDFREDIMIIFAGYTNEMQSFLNANPGLKSRIPNSFDFEDYDANDIAEIGYLDLLKGQYIVDKEDYTKNVVNQYSRSVDKSNARWIRNFNEKLTQVMAERVIETGDSDIQTIIHEDFVNLLGTSSNTEEEKEKIKEELENLVGLRNVKDFVYELESTAKFNQEMLERGNSISVPNYHMVFAGNPGTGKTTVARIIAKLFYNLGILSSSNVVEVTRSDLVGSYVGHTEKNTKDVIEKALGGVLFIDEAYQLDMGGSNSNDFGKQAIETLLPALENYRDKFVVILAGYTNEMEQFLDVNPGLRSRIPTTIEFPDYTPEDIAEIVFRALSKEFTFDEMLLRNYVSKLYSNLDSKDKANARWARNFVEVLKKNHTKRIVDNNDFENYKEIDSFTILESKC